jgi:DNA-binding NarL/FixJ family response regulator
VNDEGQILSGAEQAIVEAVLRGRSNREIAEERGTSVRTVANQMASIFRKLCVGSRSELAAANFVADSLPGPAVPLTPQEHLIASLAARGYTNKQLAYELSLAPSTIGTHLGRVRRKLRLRSRVQLARYFGPRGSGTSP